MATNLDKLLRKVEKNYETGDKTETREYSIGGETYEVRTMTRKEKSAFLYNMRAKKDMALGEVISALIKPVYNCFGLSQLAVKAKEAGYIKNYYDVVEMLFEPEELMEIAGFLFEFNHIIDKKDISDPMLEEIHEIKKQ